LPFFLCRPISLHPFRLRFALLGGEGPFFLADPPFVWGGTAVTTLRGFLGGRPRRFSRPLEGFYSPVQAVALLNQKRHNMFGWHSPQRSTGRNIESGPLPFEITGDNVK
jgi:hypothetical protein